jgi:hypothetical protein
LSIILDGVASAVSSWWLLIHNVISNNHALRDYIRTIFFIEIRSGIDNRLRSLRRRFNSGRPVLQVNDQSGRS